MAILLQAMENGQDDADSKLLLASLEMLSHVALISSEKKALLVSSGALEQVSCILVRLESMQPQKANHVSSACLKVLSNLSQDASEVLKNDHLLPLVSLVHRIMNHYLSDAALSNYGCAWLRHLSNPLLQELMAAGSVPILLQAMHQHPTDPFVQEHGNAALYNLLTICPDYLMKEINTTSSRGKHDKPKSNGISIILNGMESCEKVLAVQKFGLLALT